MVMEVGLDWICAELILLVKFHILLQCLIFPLHRGIHIITKGQRFEGSERQINHQIKI